MQIHVKAGDKIITLDVESSDTIDSVKEKVSEQTGIPKEKIQLISNIRPPPPPPSLVFKVGYVPGIGEVLVYPSGNP